MVIQDFPAHLQSLTLNNWEELFDLLPEIENTKTFGNLMNSTESEPGIFTFPNWSWEPIVYKWLNVVEKLDLMPIYDWPAWEEGSAILQEPDTDFSKLDIIALCKLFTMIVRQERFCEGYLVSCFSDNTISKIIKAIKNKVVYIDQKKVIKLIYGDITTMQVNVLVNAANSSLLGGGGVDGAIHRAGGSIILEECKKIVAKQGECMVGEAVITSGSNLSAEYIIHTVGPIWNQNNLDSPQKLRNCYINSMTLAEKYGLTSIAFPNISTGVYGYPKKEAALIAIDTVKKFPCKHITEIIFVCYDQENYDIYKSLLEN